MVNWRKVAEELGAVQSTGGGSWARRVATALGRTDSSTGPWARRVAEGQNPDGKSWDRAADKALKK